VNEGGRIGQDGPTDIQNVYEDIRGTDDWAFLRRAILDHGVILGGTDISFDLRPVVANATRLAICGDLLWQIIRPFRPEVLVGPGFGAAPLLSAIALSALRDGVELHFLMVRDNRKQHNRKRWVEGLHQPAGARAVIVDDFIGRGTAIDLVDKALAADGHNLSILACAFLFDMWTPAASRQLSVSRFPVVSVFKRHDIGLSRDAFDARPPDMRGAYPPFAGEPLWWRMGFFEKTADDDYQWKSTPAIADDAVFAADDQSRVWRHDAGTGDIQWCTPSLATPTKGIVQKLVHADKSLVYACYDGTVTRLDASDGSVIWRRRQDSSIHATPWYDRRRRMIYVNTEQWNDGDPFGHCCALNWDDGRLIWSKRLAFWTPGSPCVDDTAGLVFATPNDRSLIAIDIETGQERWRQATSGLVRGRPAVSDGRIYVIDERGLIVCRDSATGELVWSRKYGPGEGHQFTMVDGNFVYALDSKWHFLAFDKKDGRLTWMTRLRSAGNWGPVRCGRYLVVVSRWGEIAVLDPEKQVKVWEARLGGRVRQPPAIGMTRNGPLLALASNSRGLLAYRIDPFYGDDIDDRHHD